MKKEILFNIRAGSKDVTFIVTGHDQIRELIEAIREAEFVNHRYLGEKEHFVKDKIVEFTVFDHTVDTDDEWDELWKEYVGACAREAAESLGEIDIDYDVNLPPDPEKDSTVYETKHKVDVGSILENHSDK